MVEICKISQLYKALDGYDQKQFAFYLLENMLNKLNLQPESDLVTFFGFGNENQLLEALETSKFD